MVDKTILHYKIVKKLGEGGMGVVYLAEDNKLKRQVAIKFLPQHIAANSDERRRFEIEAQAAASLNHPSIATIHAIEEADDILFLVMEYIEGDELKQVIAQRHLSQNEIMDYAIQICKGLQAAHEKEVIHRDIKSSNIMITNKGDIKIMDFGLAKFRGSTQITKAGTTVGTAAYMSPEQIKGEETNHCSDIWSFGVVLYEMLTGILPFKGDYEQAVTYAILNEEPELKAFPEDTAEELLQIVRKTLNKNPHDRYQDIEEVLIELKELVGSTQSMQIPQSKTINDKKSVIGLKVLFPAVVILILLFFTGYKYITYQKQLNRAREIILPQITQLVDDMAWTGEGPESWKAFALSNQVNDYLDGDPFFEKLQSKYTVYTRFFTNPAGADVYIKSYGSPDSAWYHVGQTPVDSVRLPISSVRIKIEKPGYETLDDIIWIWTSFKSYQYDLTAKGGIPAGMVKVYGPKDLGNFLMDRYEVTNREYKKFVDEGGYTKKEYWKYDIIRDGKVIPWEKAIQLFTDKTGVAGPATWEVGDYPKGMDNYPVAGISWYEAAAYAQFAGKSLPTFRHWHFVANLSLQAEIIPLSNLSGSGMKPVGSSQSMNRFGVYDLAGNVREWCWNEIVNVEKKYILGGGWNDPDYTFHDDVAQSPLNRTATNGFRCIKYSSSSVKSEDLFKPITRKWRDYSNEKPVSDKRYLDLKHVYAYAKLPLNAKIEYIDDSFDEWIKQKVTIDAAYNNEKINLYCFLPRNSKPPFQTIIYFPGSGSRETISSKKLRDMRQIDFFPKSGRAVIYPVYKGTYERFVQDDIWEYPTLTRDLFIKWVQDFQRIVDYLETREDIDHNKLSYYGFSMGGFVSPLILSNEYRLKTAILYVAGLSSRQYLPEVDPLNFVPRVTLPVLMLNGKYDDAVPLETSQKPFYENLGTPVAHKKWIVYDNGHSVPRQELIKESLNWLDKYLGAVQK